MVVRPEHPPLVDHVWCVPDVLVDTRCRRVPLLVPCAALRKRAGPIDVEAALVRRVGVRDAELLHLRCALAGPALALRRWILPGTLRSTLRSALRSTLRATLRSTLRKTLVRAFAHDEETLVASLDKC